ncbi:hypothetical protein BQ8420_26210 [Nocardiopsis sp. JB363]|nr:hypothetical protein BQ8420_26210 [Nocardiopsis sp. JB363]
MGRVDDMFDRVWTLAALAAAVGDTPLSKEHGELLAVSGLAERGGEGWRLRADYDAVLTGQPTPDAFPRRIAELLRQAADAAEGRTTPDRSDDAASLADGRSSGRHMRLFLDALTDRIPGFAELLEHGSPRFLDVGTGVGAISAVVMERSPGARAVGLDVDPRALRLSEEYLTELGLRDRVETRLQDVADIAESDTYDLVWFPLSVLDPETAEAALPRLRAALRPGGLLMAATALASEPEAETDTGRREVHTAVARWRMSRAGTTAWEPEELGRKLSACGFEDVRSAGSPSGTVTLLTARAPAVRER